MGLPLAPGTYVIDTTHSQIGFAVRHLGISTVRGLFDSYRGTLTVGDDYDSVAVDIEVDMASVNSGNRFRDEHLHGAEFFDVAAHPTMAFASRVVKPAGAESEYVMAGDVTIKGVTRSLELDVVFNGSALFPMDGATHVGFAGRGALSRSEFGVSYGVPLVSDEVELVLDVQFIAPADPPTA
jgi:polyisoprenoid-binding protein YceI